MKPTPKPMTLRDLAKLAESENLEIWWRASSYGRQPLIEATLIDPQWSGDEVLMVHEVYGHAVLGGHREHIDTAYTRIRRTPEEAAQALYLMLDGEVCQARRHLDALTAKRAHLGGLAQFAPVPGWQPMATAPKDGLAFLALVHHPNFNTCREEDRHLWQAYCETRWASHNGGWTWSGRWGKWGSLVGWKPL